MTTLPSTQTLLTGVHFGNKGNPIQMKNSEFFDTTCSNCGIECPVITSVRAYNYN